MEGRPSIRVKLMFHDNPHGADPVSSIENVLTFPGRGHKGVVKPGQLWDCDVVFASYNYVMIAPRVELEDALDSELGVLRYCQGAREVAHIKVADATELLRSGQVPAPIVTPRPLPKKVVPPAKPTPVAPKLPSSTKAGVAAQRPLSPPPAVPPMTPPAPSPATVPAPPAPAPPPSSQPKVVEPPSAPKPAEAAVAAQAVVPAAEPASVRPATPVTPPARPDPPIPDARPVAPAPVQARSFEDFRRALDGPEGRAIVELFAERLGVTTALPRIEDTIDGQEEILSILRGESGEVRRSVKALTAQVEDIRKQTLAWRRSQTQDLRGVAKPVPKDPDHPTDDEVEREVVHQLYQKDCWGNKYGQYEKLKRGYNSKASDRQVRAAVQRLQEKRWILIYAKDTDQFRLNPARAEDIYRFLGVPDRAAEQLAEETRDELEEPKAITKRDLDTALEAVVNRPEFERGLATLRQKLSTLEERALQVSLPIETAPSRSMELTEIKGMLRGLQGELNRIKKLAEDTANAQRRLEAQVNELANA